METAYGYKLFTKDKSGNLHPLYVNSDDVLPVGKWMFAEAGQMTENGKVKSKLGDLAYRGGWHLNEECPYITHIYGKKYSENGREIEPHTGRKFDKIQKPNTVWCLVEYETTVDCQPAANERGKNKNGKIIAKNAQLPMVDAHGYYRYKTNPNMFGTWIIAGNIRIVRELSYAEVVEKYGYNVGSATTNPEKLGADSIAYSAAFRYMVKCPKCGYTIGKDKLCDLIKYPSIYSHTPCGKDSHFVRIR